MTGNWTDISVVLDRSGSMEAIRESTITGFNTFLKEQKAEPGDARLTLVPFDDEYQVGYDGMDLRAVPELTAATFVPRNSTALLDAVGQLIDDTGRRLAGLPQAQRPAQVQFVIITDGMENASQRYTQPQVLSMIKHQTDVYNWEFIFLAANQDAIASGARLGISADNSLSYDAEDASNQAMYSVVSAKLSRSRRGKRSGFTDAERSSVSVPPPPPKRGKSR